MEMQSNTKKRRNYRNFSKIPSIVVDYVDSKVDNEADYSATTTGVSDSSLEKQKCNTSAVLSFSEENLMSRTLYPKFASDVSLFNRVRSLSPPASINRPKSPGRFKNYLSFLSIKRTRNSCSGVNKSQSRSDLHNSSSDKSEQLSAKNGRAAPKKMRKTKQKIATLFFPYDEMLKTKSSPDIGKSDTDVALIDISRWNKRNPNTELIPSSAKQSLSVNSAKEQKLVSYDVVRSRISCENVKAFSNSLSVPNFLNEPCKELPKTMNLRMRPRSFAGNKYTNVNLGAMHMSCKSYDDDSIFSSAERKVQVGCLHVPI